MSTQSLSIGSFSVLRLLAAFGCLALYSAISLTTHLVLSAIASNRWQDPADIHMMGFTAGFLLAIVLSMTLQTAMRGMPSLMRYLRGEEPWRYFEQIGDRRIITISQGDRNLFVFCLFPLLSTTTGFVTSTFAIVQSLL